MSGGTRNETPRSDRPLSHVSIEDVRDERAETRYRESFGDKGAIQHDDQTDNEGADQSSESKIRSAAPVSNMGEMTGSSPSAIGRALHARRPSGAVRARG